MSFYCFNRQGFGSLEIASQYTTGTATTLTALLQLFREQSAAEEAEMKHLRKHGWDVPSAAVIVTAGRSTAPGAGGTVRSAAAGTIFKRSINNKYYNIFFMIILLQFRAFRSL